VILAGDVVKRDGQLVGAHVQRARHLMHDAQRRLRSNDAPSPSPFPGSDGRAASSRRTSSETVTR
jgi:hypothetical protein